MNFFEQQLRGIFKEVDDAKFIGRTAYIPLDESTKLKAEFVTTGTADCYEALRLILVNSQDGATDKLMLHFNDFFAKSHHGISDSCPYIWTHSGETEWYGQPSDAELQSLSAAANEYVEMFKPEQGFEQSYGM